MSITSKEYATVQKCSGEIVTELQAILGMYGRGLNVAQEQAIYNALSRYDPSETMREIMGRYIEAAKGWDRK